MAKSPVSFYCASIKLAKQPWGEGTQLIYGQGPFGNLGLNFLVGSDIFGSAIVFQVN